MRYYERRWCLTKVASVEELVARLMNEPRSLCAAFELDGLLFLNDSVPAESLQGWAVVRWYELDGHRLGVQLDSFAFEASAPGDLAGLLRQVLANDPPSTMAVECYPETQTPEEHGRCCFCDPRLCGEEVTHARQVADELHPM